MKNKLSAEALAFFREQGSRGGRKAARQLTAEQKQDRARAGGLARQAKRKASALEQP